MTAREVPAISGSASEGACRRNRCSGSAAGGWGRELNLRHCHPAEPKGESGWSAIGIVNTPSSSLSCARPVPPVILSPVLFGSK
jgi:hypothetical protein